MVAFEDTTRHRTKGKANVINVKWDSQTEQIVVWQFSSPWTWNEFFAAMKDMNHLIDGVDGIVDTILLTSSEQTIPPSALTNIRNLMTQLHERNDLVVLVGSKAFLTALINHVTSIIPNVKEKYRFAHDVSEAYAIIEQARQQRREVTPRVTL